MLVHAQRDELADRPIAELVVSGKELQLGHTVAAARTFLGRPAVKAVAVLDGSTYAGTVDLEALAGADDGDPVGPFARDLLPVARRGTRAAEALAALDVHGGNRLVVVDEDDTTYVGIVCLRGDRRRLCVDADRLASAREQRP